MAETPFSRRALLQAPALTATSALTATGVAAQTQQTAPPTGPIKVISQTEFSPQEMAQFTQGKARPVQFVYCKTAEEFRAQLRDAEVVYGNLRGADLDFAPKLRWIQASGAGVEGMDETIRKSPIPLTNMARTFAPGISETAIGLLLSLTRGITKHYYPQFLRKEWKAIGTVKSDDHVEISGRTMGLVGFGGIGEAVGRRAHFGFDMKILATDAKPMQKPFWVEELRDPSWFQEMVPQVDVLVSAAPSTPQTRRMFNEQVFRRMKKSAIFLGMSRGDLFDDMALVKALKEGWIAGAGLDVFPQEPIPSTHPIFECPNVVMTPHTSGWSVDRQKRLVALFAENLRRYAAGIPLINVVDKQAGY